MAKTSLASIKSRKKRCNKAFLVEYVQEMQADLFNLTSISKKKELYKQFLQYDLKSL